MNRLAKSNSLRTIMQYVIIGIILINTLAYSGCGAFPSFQDIFNGGTSLKESTITGDVIAISESSGLPELISGTVTGEFEGTYQEIILDLFLDNDGNLLAAISRSQFTFSAPQIGTITSMNLILVVDALVTTDGTGPAIPIGLSTASSGEIVLGTGAFEGMTGHIHTDSTLMFGSGEFGLGSLESNLTLTFN